MEPGTKKRLRRVTTLLVVAVVGAGGWYASGSEPVQRAFGRREMFRVPLAEVRSEYASANVERVTEFVLVADESLIQNTEVTTVDRASQRAVVTSSNALTNLTIDGVAPVTGTFGPGPASTTIVTFDALFERGPTEADPWMRSPRQPYVDNSALDPYIIPTFDDVVGFELAAIPSRDPRVDGSEGGDIEPITAGDLPGDDTPSALVNVPERAPSNVPEDVVKMMRWSGDAGTFRQMSPVGYEIAGLSVPDGTSVTFTFGFDEAGLLRYLDATVDSRAATAGLASEDQVLVNVTWRATSVSDDPTTIDLPINVVDSTPTA
jgi:hypothetical protein